MSGYPTRIRKIAMVGVNIFFRGLFKALSITLSHKLRQRIVMMPAGQRLFDEVHPGTRHIVWHRSCCQLACAHAHVHVHGHGHVHVHVHVHVRLPVWHVTSGTSAV